MSTLALLAAGLLLSGTPAAPSGEARVDDVPEFAVPFGCGLSFPVSQAHDTGSHKNTDVWAWDFKMPEGVPITSAGEGVVRLARGDSSIGGCGEEYAAYANYVVVAHPSGHETQYLHFQKVVVKPGDKVKAGDLLGYAGKTGWACGSHLHFKVTRASGTGWNNHSVPARLVGFGDPQTQTVVRAMACQTAQEVPLVAEVTDEDEQGSAAGAALQRSLPSGQLTVDEITGGASGAAHPKPVAGETQP